MWRMKSWKTLILLVGRVVRSFFFFEIKKNYPNDAKSSTIVREKLSKFLVWMFSFLSDLSNIFKVIIIILTIWTKATGKETQLMINDY